jgi:acetolactate synthase-1/2/3 large subunit
LTEKAGDDSFPVLPQRFVADVRAVMPDDGLVALDNGMYKLWFARGYEARLPNTLLLDNALATMGAGLPSAIAACLVDADRPVLAVCGDGGFLMNSQEFETAIRMKIRLTVVVLRDDGYGMIKWKQEAAGMENFGLEFGNPDFVKYAEAYGAKGYCPSSAAEIRPLLERCLKEDGVKLVEIPIEYAENDRVFTKELKNVVCR